MSNDAARRPESRLSCWPSIASGIRRIDGTSDRSSSKQGGTSWQTSPRRPAYRPGHPVQPDGQRGHAPRRRQPQHLYGGLLCRGRRAVGAFVSCMSYMLWIARSTLLTYLSTDAAVLSTEGTAAFLYRGGGDGRYRYYATEQIGKILHIQRLKQ